MKDTCKCCGKSLSLNDRQVGGVHMDCEHEYYYNKDIRMIKIRPGKGYPFAVMTPDEASELVNDLSPEEDGFQVTAVMMSRGEIEALSEFEGW